MNRGFAALTDKDLDRAAILAHVLEQAASRLQPVNVSPLKEYFNRLNRDTPTDADVSDLVDVIQCDLFAVKRGLKPHAKKGTKNAL